MKKHCRVFAVAAHPDDIEFEMGGTLFLLKQAGCEIHYMNIANGSCGSAEYDAQKIVAIRLDEAQNACRRLGAVFHPPLVPDLEIFYEKGLLARISSIMREVTPNILLVPSPQDYMEDHMNASRLAVTAVFCRGIPNFPVNPPRPPVMNEVTVYHAQPYGNRDQLNHPIRPDFLVNIAAVIEEKTAMLAEHKSQRDWLDYSQGVGAYLEAMRQASREMGILTGKWEYAEGWRHHHPIGFCAPEADPLGDLLRDRIMDL